MTQTSSVLNTLWTPWWTWNRESAALGDWVYRCFNLFEAAAWFVFAFLVLDRWRRNRTARIEIAYSVSFAIFGPTDIAEAWQQSLPLLLIKGVVLVVLLTLRSWVRTNCYPTARLY